MGNIPCNINDPYYQQRGVYVTGDQSMYGPGINQQTYQIQNPNGYTVVENVPMNQKMYQTPMKSQKKMNKGVEYMNQDYTQEGIVRGYGAPVQRVEIIQPATGRMGKNMGANSVNIRPRSQYQYGTQNPAQILQSRQQVGEQILYGQPTIVEEDLTVIKERPVIERKTFVQPRAVEVETPQVFYHTEDRPRQVPTTVYRPHYTTTMEPHTIMKPVTRKTILPEPAYTTVVDKVQVPETIIRKDVVMEQDVYVEDTVSKELYKEKVEEKFGRNYQNQL